MYLGTEVWIQMVHLRKCQCPCVPGVLGDLTGDDIVPDQAPWVTVPFLN